MAHMIITAFATKFKKPTQIMLLMATAIMGLSVFSTSTAIANDTSKITKERLDKFYEDSIVAQLASVDEAMAFTEKHLHEDLETIMHMTSKIEGGLDQEETSVYDKAKFLEDTRKGFDVGKIEEIKSEVVSYDIAKDERSAQVKDRIYSMASIPMPVSETEIQMYTLRQFVNCDNLYVLNDADVLQIKTSTCEVKGQLSRAQDL